MWQKQANLNLYTEIKNGCKQDKSHVLWENKDLHDKNAEKDQIGAGDVVFEGWQGCCSVLEEWREGGILYIIIFLHSKIFVRFPSD